MTERSQFFKFETNPLVDTGSFLANGQRIHKIFIKNITFK